MKGKKRPHNLLNRIDWSNNRTNETIEYERENAHEDKAKHKKKSKMN